MERSTEPGTQSPATGPVRRRRRRAVGPPGATPTGNEPALGLEEDQRVVDDDERLRRDRPPHHDQGV